MTSLTPPATRLTYAIAHAELAALGVVLARTPFAEFRVRVRGAAAGEGYITTDLADALATGRLLAERLGRTATANTIRLESLD